jgi:hypothetical protein
MGILDEAIREHLELKRQHGADDSELKKLEDDAFGPPQRPQAAGAMSDTAAEAPTEFMAQPALGGAAAQEEGTAEQEQAAQEEPEPEAQRPARREPVADVQEAPPAADSEPPAPEAEADSEEAPVPEAEGDAEEQSAVEHEIPPAAPPAGSHSTEERQAIADQPTQMFDVESEFEPPQAPEPADPSDDELADEEASEPRLGPVEPIGTIDGGDEDEEEDDFFDEKRLSDELNQALEAPIEEDEAEVGQQAISEEHEEPVSEEHEEPISEEHEQPASATEDEDVLEETPDFLEDAPEDEQLWFEQKPPKDFDFDD